MSSALAAAMRELERSKERLELELSANADFAALRQLEMAGAAATPEAQRQRQVLQERLAILRVYQALQAIVAARRQLEGEAVSPTVASEAGLAPPQAPARTPGVAVEAAPPLLRQFTPPPGPPQPLTAIRGISAATARRLQAMGIERYEQIAAWRASDVAAVRTALGIGREISRCNWIEQAALLTTHTAPRPAVSQAMTQTVSPVAPAAATKPSLAAAPIGTARPDIAQIVGGAAAAAVAGAGVLTRRRGQPISAPEITALSLPIAMHRPATRPLPPLAATPAPVARKTFEPLLDSPHPLTAQVTQASPPAPTSVAALPQPEADLRLVRGIDATLAEALRNSGVRSFAAIAGWRRQDVDAMAAVLGIRPRDIARQGWIEQAAMLARGEMTDFSRRSLRGELAALRPLPPAPPPLPERQIPAIPEAAALAAAARIASLRAATDAVVTVDLPRNEPPDEAAREPSPPPEPAETEWPQRLEVLQVEAASASTPAEEATVTIIQVARSPQPPSVASPMSATAPLAARTAPRHGEVPTQRRILAIEAEADALAIQTWESRQAATRADRAQREVERRQRAPITSPIDRPSGSEEAMVEIIHHDLPLPAASRDAGATASAIRPPAPAAKPPEIPAAAVAPQPAWIRDTNDAAGGVVRRFLKALKREA